MVSKSTAIRFFDFIVLLYLPLVVAPLISAYMAWWLFGTSEDLREAFGSMDHSFSQVQELLWTPVSKWIFFAFPIILFLVCMRGKYGFAFLLVGVATFVMVISFGASSGFWIFHLKNTFMSGYMPTAIVFGFGLVSLGLRL